MNPLIHIAPPGGPISDPSAWTGDQMLARDEWRYELAEAEIAELENAADAAERCGKTTVNVTAEDFPLDGFAKTIAQFCDDLENGRGFVLIRGLPIERYSIERTALIYWGIGQHMGIPVSQNAEGAMLTNVQDKSYLRKMQDGGPVRERLYSSNREGVFHADPSDVVGLLCIRPSKAGGKSRISSSINVYNEMLRRDPELVDILHQPLPGMFDYLEEQHPQQPRYNYTVPFSFHAGRMSIHWPPQSEELVVRYPEIGTISPRMVAAREMFQEIADAASLDMGFRPGDIQFLNNYTICHSRESFEDYDEPERKRRLIRIHLTLHAGRPLATNFSRANGWQDHWGGRGGVRDFRKEIDL